MHLVKLTLERLRVLKSVNIAPCPGLNVFSGPNGSGKTSVLEGVYLLGTARSFRATRPRELVTQGQERLLARGEISTSNGYSVSIGVEQGAGASRIRRDGEDVRSASSLARSLPLILISPDSQKILFDGAELRRGIIDWALFHVEQDYGSIHSQFRRSLKQRNAQLRNGSGFGAAEARAWDRALIEQGELIHLHRARYLEHGLAVFSEFVEHLLGRRIDISYFPGWAPEKALSQALAESSVADQSRGFTTVGPHRADLRFEVDGVRAHRVLSRGEAKLFVIALMLSQAQFLQESKGERCIVLLDELASELDASNRARVQSSLVSLGCQTFLTTVSPDLLPDRDDGSANMFHVEQGEVAQVV